MKKCPVCHRTYSDPSLNFCLEDGATLVALTGNFGQPPQNFAAMSPPAKKSNPLLWILGILGGIAVLGIIGFVGLVALIAASGGGNSNSKRLANGGGNSNGGIYPTNFKVSNGGSTSPAKNGESIDLIRWGERKGDGGETKIVGDEFQMAAAKSSFYYVIVSSSKFDDKYLTNNATTKVTVHAVSGISPTLGYGLIINSDIVPLKTDYAFLINSDNQTFRVVRHENKQEKTVTPWTPAAQIRTGTQTNQLEVRSAGDSLTFYINGQIATSLSDESEADEGIVGLYTSDTAPVGFSNLQVIKN